MRKQTKYETALMYKHHIHNAIIHIQARFRAFSTRLYFRRAKHVLGRSSGTLVDARRRTTIMNKSRKESTNASADDLQRLLLAVALGNDNNDEGDTVSDSNKADRIRALITQQAALASQTTSQAASQTTSIEDQQEKQSKALEDRITYDIHQRRVLNRQMHLSHMTESYSKLHLVSVYVYSSICLYICIC